MYSWNLKWKPNWTSNSSVWSWIHVKPWNEKFFDIRLYFMCTQCIQCSFSVYVCLCAAIQPKIDHKQTNRKWCLDRLKIAIQLWRSLFITYIDYRYGFLTETTFRHWYKILVETHETGIWNESIIFNCEYSSSQKKRADANRILAYKSYNVHPCIMYKCQNFITIHVCDRLMKIPNNRTNNQNQILANLLSLTFYGNNDNLISFSV